MKFLYAMIMLIGILHADERIGLLENGLTYYIKHNEFPKEKASLRLVVKVGSIYETEEERGLAHFLEHMVFRGSLNFSDWEIIKYLESIGAEFGADTNAFTTFEETCYILQVPLDKKDSLDKALLMLSDFAGRASLKDELIEKERTVVMDEYNISQKQAGTRIYNQMHEEFFNNSAYGNRMPIGDKEVINHCDPNLIRNFYKKWYRPNRMAVIAVGDFDIDLVENRIKECFSNLSPGEETIVSTEVLFPGDVRSLYMVEEEEMFVQGGFTQFYVATCPMTISEEQMRLGLVHSLVSSILNYRLELLSKEHPAPFLAGGMISQSFTTFHEALRLHFVGFMDRPLDGVRAICREIERLKQFGPTKGELDREIFRLQEEISTGIENLDRIDNEVFIQSYVNHFLCSIPLKSMQAGYELNRKFLAEIRTEDIALWVEENINLDTMYRIFSMPFENVISVNDVEQVIQEVKNEKLEPPKEISNSLLCVMRSGFVGARSAVANDNIGSTMLILDNGMKVILHKTSLEKGRISIDMVARYGKTMFNPEEYDSIELAPAYLMGSGLANLNGNDFNSFLQKRDCSFAVAIGLNARSIYASGPSDESEVLLQSIRALFLDKRFDPVIWNSIVGHHTEIEKYKNNKPELFFIETANQIIYDNHPFYMEGKIAGAEEEVAKRCVELAFNDPLEFSLIVVGDFDLLEMQDLISNYFHFPEKVKHEKKEVQLPILLDFTESQNEIIYRGKETHSSTIIGYRKNYKGEVPLKFPMKALSHILSERCLKRMRQELGDTYTVSFMYESLLDPVTENIFAYVYFTSTPEKAEGLKKIAIEVIDEFLKNGPTADEVLSAKEIIRQKIKEAKVLDGFWSNLHKASVLQDRNIDELLMEAEELEVITQKGLQNLSVELFENTPTIRISLFPEHN